MTAVEYRAFMTQWLNETVTNGQKQIDDLEQQSLQAIQSISKIPEGAAK